MTPDLKKRVEESAKLFSDPYSKTAYILGSKDTDRYWRERIAEGRE